MQEDQGGDFATGHSGSGKWGTEVTVRAPTDFTSDVRNISEVEDDSVHKRKRQKI